MKRFYASFSCALLILLAFSTNAQPKYILYKLTSGLSVIHHYTSPGKIRVQVYTRAGSIFENESNSGINALMLKIAENKIRVKAEDSNIQFNTVLETEFVGFELSAADYNLEEILKLISYHYFSFSVSQKELDNAIEDITAQKISIAQTLIKDMEYGVNKGLWGRSLLKVTPNGVNEQYKSISLKSLEDHHKRYFHLPNSTFCYSGSLTKSELDVRLNSALNFIEAPKYDPLQITRILDLKPVVNYTQRVFPVEPIFSEKVGIVFQNPGSRYDRKGSYCASILAQILSDFYGQELNFQYTPNNYYGLFSFSKDVIGDKPKTTIKTLEQIIADIKTFKLIDTNEIKLAKEMIAEQQRMIRDNDPELYMRQIAQFRHTNDEHYIIGFADSLQSITEKDMALYIQDYFVNRTGVRYWMASNSKIKSVKENERLYDLDESVGDIKLFYEPNKIDLSGDSNLTNLDKMIQWLQINDDFVLQINGCADRGEFNRVSDKEVQTFVDSVPTFVKVIPYIIKTKEMRPEMMRALKVMKTLYENGIDIDRMNGTSMTFSSDTEEKASENRRCTFTLDKRMRTIPLREMMNSK
jgi:predicted Zn-dependent peptidase